jgi:hypothetical protein
MIEFSNEVRFYHLYAEEIEKEKMFVCPNMVSPLPQSPSGFDKKTLKLKIISNHLLYYQTFSLRIYFNMN